MRDEFVRQVEHYLAYEITLDTLEDWTAPRFMALASLGEADPVARLWATLQACMYELAAEHVDEAWCRAALAEALAEVQPPRTVARAAWQSTARTAAPVRTIDRPSRSWDETRSAPLTSAATP